MAGGVANGRIFYGYWLVGAAFVAQFVSAGAQSYVAGPFLAPMTEELGWSVEGIPVERPPYEELGWSRAEYTIPRSLGQFVAALVGFAIGTSVDRFGGRRFALIGTTLLAASLMGLSRVDALWQWVLLNGVGMTVGAALMGNLVVNVTLAKWFVAFRGRAVALSAMGVSFAGVALTPMTTAVIDARGWRAAWWLLGVASALVTYPIALLFRRAPEDYGLRPDGVSGAARAERADADYALSWRRGEALRNVTFYLLVLAFGLFVINIGVVLLHAIPFMTDAGYSRETAALTIAVASVPALLSKPVWGYFIDRSRPRPLAAGSAALTGVALLVIVGSARQGSVNLVHAGFFLLGCGWGGMIPLQEVIWAAFFGRRYLGAVRSAALPFSLLFGAGGPLAVAYYFDRVGNYDGAFVAIAGLSLLSAVLLLAVTPPLKRTAG